MSREASAPLSSFLRSMKQTPLHDQHSAAGATLVEFGGWHMPVQYGPILDEVRRVRERAGLFDLSHMGRVLLDGPQALELAERLVSCFVAKIPLGSIRYGCLCKEDGMPLDDLLVYRDSPDSIYLVVNAANTGRDLDWIRGHAEGMQLTIDDQTDATAMLAVQGPASPVALQPCVEGLELEDLGYYKFGFATVCGIENVRISRTGYTGETGYELYLPAEQAARVWGEILAAGGEHGVEPIGLGARDTLRLEAGMSLYGHEIDEQHDPIQAGLNFAVSFKEEKGDWIGRSALAAIKESPKRTLVGIRTDGKRVPRQGYALMRGDARVGEVVSGAVSPTLNTNIGTAYVPKNLAEPGTELELELRGKRQACTVCELPFYSRTRK
jgi:glycine cleavage system T protein (aminomethyltransferase)